MLNVFHFIAVQGARGAKEVHKQAKESSQPVKRKPISEHPMASFADTPLDLTPYYNDKCYNGYGDDDKVHTVKLV